MQSLRCKDPALRAHSRGTPSPRLFVPCTRSAGTPSCSSTPRCVVVNRNSKQPATRRQSIKVLATPSFMSLPSLEGYIEAEAVKGIRIVMDADVPKAEYLIKWKDGSEDTWELAANLSEDLVRDYEDKWWNAARKAEFDTMAEMLGGGREVLAAAVNEDRRSALHFAAALGKPECVKLLIEAGANVNLQDREGYTPLHMAAGYMHTAAMAVLLEGGANPQLKDNSGKDVVSLIENIRSNMPLSLGTVMQRMRLETVCNTLTEMLYEEVQFGSILEERKGADGKREFLVSFLDGREDAWVHERDVAADVLEDYEQGLEFAEAQAIVDMVQVGTERKFKIQWGDNYPTSWEPEEHVPPDLIKLFEQQNPQLFEERVAAANDAAATLPTNDYQTQWSGVKPASAGSQSVSVNAMTITPEMLHANGNGNGNGNGSSERKGEEVMAGVA